MALPGMVVVFIILVVLYMVGYPIPPLLVRVIYAIIVLLIVIVLQALRFLDPLPAMRITGWHEREHIAHEKMTSTF